MSYQKVLLAVPVVLSALGAVVRTPVSAASALLLEPLSPPAIPAMSGPILLREDLRSNRSNALPPNTLQLTLCYDGDPGTLALDIQFLDLSTHAVVWETVNGEYGTGAPLSSFGTKIHTFEYDLAGYEPTGLVNVRGVKANGAVDGVCFGLFWKSKAGVYQHLQSADFLARSNSSCDFWGMWPVAMSEAGFDAVTPQITDGNAKAQARSMLWGSRMLGDGLYNLKPLMDLR